MEKRSELEFDIFELLIYLKKKIWVILLAAVVFAIGGYIAGKVLITPTYTAASRIYVFREGDSMDYSGLQIATQLRRDCEILITGENVTKQVIAELDLNMSPAELGSGIEVSSQENTRILELKYTSADPEQAALILNTVCRIAAQQIKDIMDVDVVKVIYEAAVPTVPSSTSASANGSLFALIGAGCSLAVLILLFLLDDTIRTEEDVERRLGLSTLATIPASEELGTAKRSLKSKGLRRRKK